MASTKFCGAVATQVYHWGYTCEHCGKKVEKQGKISACEGSTHKSTSWVTIPAAGAEQLKLAAELKLVKVKDEFDDRVNRGDSDRYSDMGECPFCKELQHWAPEIRNRKDPSAKNSKSWIGCGLAVSGFLGACVVIIALSLFVDPRNLQSTGKTMMIVGIPVGAAAGIALMAVLTKGHDRKIAAAAAKLESVEKHEPEFMGWDDPYSSITGMSVR